MLKLHCWNYKQSYGVSDDEQVWPGYIGFVYFLQGGRKYQIKGCAGQGGFAQVFKACIDSNPDEIVALKVG